MKESVFFGNEGLTSTSANYYANIAQENDSGCHRASKMV